MATRIPINKEANLTSSGFDDRQKRIWQEMESDMERRRREWEEEIEKMRKGFFNLGPEDGGLGGGGGGSSASTSSLPLGMGLGDRLGPRSRLLDAASSAGGCPSSGADDSRGMVVKDEKGNPVFKVLFDVHDYRPDEVSVKMDSHKVMVSARHQGSQGGSSVSREYSRQVTLPSAIDPDTLQCSMGPDGVLAVEAPIPAPNYPPVRDNATTLPIRTASTSSSSSSTPNPNQQSSTTYHSSTYQQGPEAAAATTGYPAGFKPVVAQMQNAAPPVGSCQQTSSSTIRESTSGISKAAPPPPPAFQPMPTQHIYSSPIKTSGIGSASAGMGLGSSSSSSSSPGGGVVLSEPGKFKVEIDIEDFKPEELTVKTQDQRVVIFAKREEKKGNSSSSRELSRERSLPDSVDPMTIKAFFTDGGKLIIEAPYKNGAAQS